MIYLKLALRNLTRSLRDYAIYFFTVTFSVMIFYTFNSLKDQPVVVAVCQQAGMDTNLIAVMLAATSVFVAFIVAALVLYSNNFIIRRSKRELGVYLLLGMHQGTVARMLFVETLAVGVVACVLGIAVGILFSGVFTILFSLLLNTPLPGQLFSFSFYSTLLTVIFYGLIFFGVGILGSFSVSRFTLASLLAANRTNEVYRARSRWVTAVFGVISLAVLGYGYFIAVRAIASPSFNPMDPVYVLVAVLMIIGSFGFFYAGIGFLFDLLRGLERFRWKGLNTFTLQQIMKKVNSNTLVLTATNLLLAMTITSVVFLVAFQTIFEKEKTAALPYAYAVLYLDPHNDLSGFDQAAAANPENPLLNKLSLTRYATEISAFDLMLPQDIDADQPVIGGGDAPCTAVALSEYNAARQAKGMSAVQLGAGELAAHTGAEDTRMGASVQKAIDAGLRLELGGSSYRVSQVFSQPFISAALPGSCTLIAPDTAASGLSLDDAQTTLMFDYANGKDPIVEQSLEAEIYRVGGGYWTSKGEEAANLQVAQTFIMFSGLFVEIILLVACASVLGLQQLIETVESVHHYQNLHNLGADDGQIKRSIFQQV
ncbi:MAG TPA: ABC transporter permease, partial [Anaerolineaceae bacterium]|nr:ABC transporter permease [Anaerolineaceae bacterium]